MRVPILVLSLVAAPFFASDGQSRAKATPPNRSQSSVKQSAVRSDDRNQQGQHDDACEGAASASPSSNAKDHRADDQRGQNGREGEGEGCPAKAPPPAPVPVGLGQIHGAVYHDQDKNGVRATYEPGLAGWTVQMTGPVNASVATDANGAYAFTALPVGIYKVCVTVQAGWVQSQPKSRPACATGLGDTLDVPASMPDVYYGMIDFGHCK